MDEINTVRFAGWSIRCPFCGNTEYINDEDLMVDIDDDETHTISCEKCKKEFEIKI